MDTKNSQDDVPQEQIAPEQTPASTVSNTAPANPTTAGMSAQTIQFSKKQQAKLIMPPADTPAADIVAALGLAQPRTVLLMIGAGDDLPEAMAPYLTQLFSRSVARAAVDMNSLIIDGGRNSGATAMMGLGVADRGRKAPLLGVAPAEKVTFPGDTRPGPKGKAALDPNHSHFILADGDDWGDETETLLQVSEHLSQPGSLVAVLVGGDAVAKKQVLECVRRGWPVVVLKETGGLADDLANQWQQRSNFIPDTEMAEIIVDGRLYFVQLTNAIGIFERLLEQLLNMQGVAQEQSILELTWQHFALYDHAANRQQRHFIRMQFWILTLGVLGTFLAIVQIMVKIYGDDSLTPYVMADQVLYYILLLIPVSVAALIAAANRFSAGNKWIFLRASAETLKKEIYRYRTRVEIYSDQQTKKTSRDMKLYLKEEALGRKLMQTEVNLSALPPYNGPIPPKYGAADGDDGLSFLTPERYMKYRLEDQLSWYQNKTVKLEKQLQRLQWLVYIFGGLGTLLVAVGLEIWIAFTSAIVGAFTTYIEYRQIEGTLMRYNQTATDLTGIRGWWIALSPEEQADPKNIDKLVGQTEATIHAEHASWVQGMQDALAELRAEQTEEQNKDKGDTTQDQETAVLTHQ